MGFFTQVTSVAHRLHISRPHLPVAEAGDERGEGGLPRAHLHESRALDDLGRDLGVSRVPRE